MVTSREALRVVHLQVYPSRHQSYPSVSVNQGIYIYNETVVTYSLSFISCNNSRMHNLLLETKQFVVNVLSEKQVQG